MFLPQIISSLFALLSLMVLLNGGSAADAAATRLSQSGGLRRAQEEEDALTLKKEKKTSTASYNGRMEEDDDVDHRDYVAMDCGVDTSSCSLMNGEERQGIFVCRDMSWRQAGGGLEMEEKTLCIFPDEGMDGDQCGCCGLEGCPKPCDYPCDIKDASGQVIIGEGVLINVVAHAHNHHKASSISSSANNTTKATVSERSRQACVPKEKSQVMVVNHFATCAEESVDNGADQ